jgi:vanillate O-demethylase monooxygenase subunit
MFVRNQWYVFGWDREIGRKPLGRTICGEPIVLYRTLAGAVVALEDACPHRLLPLSMGLIEGDNLRCRYHGVLFDGHGHCLEMPGQVQKRDTLRAKTYPVVERYRFVWVWIGAADKADPALIPDLWPCAREGWAFEGGSHFIKADYRLNIDNLMDLTHETHVHPGSIGQSELLDAPIEVTAEGDKVLVSRWMDNIIPPPFWATNSRYDGPMDRWQICEYLFPSTVIIDVGVAPAGQIPRGGDRTQGTNGFVIDCMTPSSETSHWYFWGMARNFLVGDIGFGDRVKAAQHHVFSEDVEVLEAQQRSLDALPDRKMRVFDIDGGGVRARVMIDRALKAQAAAKTA